jgi:hypothetical protein
MKLPSFHGPSGAATVAPGSAHGPRSGPDARPMRVALGAGFLAVLSAIVSGIVAPPQPTVGQGYDPGLAGAPATPSTAERQIVYVQLKPGETAPPGATVIDAAAPTPVTVVTVVAAPAQKPVLVKTTQSGKKVP